MPKAMSLPDNWNEMTLDALWAALNDPKRFAGGEEKKAPPQGRGKQDSYAEKNYQAPRRK